MTNAVALSSAIEERLRSISQAAGYHTDVAGVYGFGERKPDRAPLPCLLVRIGTDELVKRLGKNAQRLATYTVEGQLPRAASLADLQQLHHDIVRSLGAGGLPMFNQTRSEWSGDESVEYDPEQNGSTMRSLICVFQVSYLENYGS